MSNVDRHSRSRRRAASMATGRRVHTSPHTRQCHQSAPCMVPSRAAWACARPHCGSAEPSVNGPNLGEMPASDSPARSDGFACCIYKGTHQPGQSNKPPKEMAAPKTKFRRATMRPKRRDAKTSRSAGIHQGPRAARTTGRRVGVEHGVRANHGPIAFLGASAHAPRDPRPGPDSRRRPGRGARRLAPRGQIGSAKAR